MGSQQSQPKKEQSNMDQQQKHFSSIFTDMWFQSKKQYITIKGYFQPINDNVKPDMIDIFQVQDSTTVSDLKKQWFEKNQDNKFVKQWHEKYQDNQLVQCYGQEYTVTLQLRRSLKDTMTIGGIKHMLKIRQCNVKVQLYIFPSQIHNGCIQSAISYSDYEEINFFEVETTFKIIHSQQPFYFTIKTPREINISALKSMLEMHISLQQSNHLRIRYNIQKGYRLKIKQDALTLQQMDMIRQQLAYDKIEDNMQVSNGFIDFTQLSDYYLRQICPPGEVIYFQPQDKDFQIIGPIELLKQQYDVEIRITCTIKRHNNKYEKITITSNYQTIRNIQVSTLLTEHRVYDAMFTSVSMPNLLIRPYEKFNVLDTFISLSQLTTYELTAIPQNLLFYSQLMKSNDSSHADLIENLKLKHLGWSQHDRNGFMDQFIERRNRLVHDYKLPSTTNVIQTILLYTGPFFYTQLNKFMRSNSLAFLNNGVNKQKSWEYPFCQEILKSLEKFQNYQGTVYRGSSGYKYKMEKGDIIEWNGFTSTTNNINIAQKFISKSFVYPYIFEIKTFSGKFVADFSFYRNESEVLILPYTKFKVMDITLKDNIKYVRLKQLPLPKKIPGRLIVWVDTNYRQNAGDFYEIVVKNNLTNVEIVQLESNEHLEMWLQQYFTLLNPPLIELAFISNMNRPSQQQNAGIRTFEIIRSFSPQAQVVYYIQQIQQKTRILQQAGIHIDNRKVFIAYRKIQLQHIILYNLWKKAI